MEGGWMGGWVDGWVDGWVGGWMGCVFLSVSNQHTVGTR